MKNKPAIKAVEKTSASKDVDVNAVVKANVVQTVNDIRNRSKVIAEMEGSGDVMLIGAYYSLDDGKVTLVGGKHHNHHHCEHSHHDH